MGKVVIWLPASLSGRDETHEATHMPESTARVL